MYACEISTEINTPSHMFWGIKWKHHNETHGQGNQKIECIIGIIFLFNSFNICFETVLLSAHNICFS